MVTFLPLAAIDMVLRNLFSNTPAQQAYSPVFRANRIQTEVDVSWNKRPNSALGLLRSYIGYQSAVTCGAGKQQDIQQHASGYTDLMSVEVGVSELPKWCCACANNYLHMKLKSFRLFVGYSINLSKSDTTGGDVLCTGEIQDEKCINCRNKRMDDGM